MTLELATVEPGDLDRLVAIERAAFARPWSRNLLARELDNRISTVLGARDEAGELWGFAIWWTVADEIHLLDVAVHPDRQRRGIARSLMERCLEAAREAGAAWVLLEVRESNEAARALYRSLGFRESGIRPGYYRDTREDAIILELET